LTPRIIKHYLKEKQSKESVIIKKWLKNGQRQTYYLPFTIKNLVARLAPLAYCGFDQALPPLHLFQKLTLPFY
jgi:hypothetical protein